MRRLLFAIWLSLPGRLASQARAIPARDLLAFPIGLTAEAPVLETQNGDGLWNPATALVPDGNRWRVGAAAMSAPHEIAVSAQLFTAAAAWRGTTLGLTVARAAVGDLLRTDSDPQTIGDEIPYSTVVTSAIAARRLAPSVVGGLALRWRNGRADNLNRSSASVDFGVLAEHLTPLDVRVGGSTFLWGPWAAGGERASYLVGLDGRFAGTDTARTARIGYALQQTDGLSTEQYVFATGRWGRWDARGGPVRTEIFGGSSWRLRLGLAVRHGGYAVGVAREESVSGLAPTYHFSLSSVLK